VVTHGIRHAPHGVRTPLERVPAALTLAADPPTSQVGEAAPAGATLLRDQTTSCDAGVVEVDAVDDVVLRGVCQSGAGLLDEQLPLLAPLLLARGGAGRGAGARWRWVGRLDGRVAAEAVLYAVVDVPRAGVDVVVVEIIISAHCFAKPSSTVRLFPPC
jgi:hypothetical protein